ncbi:SDR family NAD(P)-dependent oxidoreductase, partial [Xanthomonas euvesicatoria]|uniref:SDR family NAD(P)-dependent oxidoreductase n=1 Tax=Xanthomonas euvesicatoria TaxID=456327 RepID=UPI0030C7DE68
MTLLAHCSGAGYSAVQFSVMIVVSLHWIVPQRRSPQHNGRTCMTQQHTVAVITGASRGIGAAIAQRLAGDGFAVVLNYAGHADEADQLVRSIEAAGGRAISVQADV